MPVVPEPVFGSRGVPVHRLQVTDEVLRCVCPEPGWKGLGAEIVDHRLVGAERAWRWHVPMNAVVQRWDVRRPLNRGMAAQRQDAAAWATHVPEQELEQRAGPD